VHAVPGHLRLSRQNSACGHPRLPAAFPAV